MTLDKPIKFKLDLSVNEAESLYRKLQALKSKDSLVLKVKRTLEQRIYTYYRKEVRKRGY